jgi:hypothetical protein
MDFPLMKSRNGQHPAYPSEWLLGISPSHPTRLVPRKAPNKTGLTLEGHAVTNWKDSLIELSFNELGTQNVYVMPVSKAAKYLIDPPTKKQNKGGGGIRHKLTKPCMHILIIK